MILNLSNGEEFGQDVKRIKGHPVLEEVEE